MSTQTALQPVEKEGTDRLLSGWASRESGGLGQGAAPELTRVERSVYPRSARHGGSGRSGVPCFLSTRRVVLKPEGTFTGSPVDRQP
jgi:hypothetical protein